ncbi:hypothetical protein CSB45_14755 [candidate division KSB3 bacterium]|uniref:Uncharacterized protein n=1 Tax=candidate division KSB3 bacterium TaxID=2044937 RepID=A0A2G6E0W4_9BACT|nr:MAG: hypothetical protein CSB45_14755 [candidate division KSB3 bacterium]PIE31083.1 MAG: hypothetical protein CSA57_00270 [candidate division KSB3 bacterium]
MLRGRPPGCVFFLITLIWRESLEGLSFFPGLGIPALSYNAPLGHVGQRAEPGAANPLELNVFRSAQRRFCFRAQPSLDGAPGSDVTT